MGRKLTHEEFMIDFIEKNKNAENIEILGEYEGSKIKIKCRCKIDGYEWETLPQNLLKGYGCPKCGEKIKIKKQTKTHEEFMQEFYEKNKNAENIEILEKYKGINTKIKCKCKIDGYEWEVTPNNLLNGRGCPKCSGKNKTTEYFINELKEINDSIEILGEYKGSNIKIKCKCKIDGYEWEALPQNLLKGYGCPKCGGTMKLTHEEFLERFYIKNKNAENIEILGEYINNATKIKCKCKVDGYEWETTPSHLLRGYGCPICAGNIQKTHKDFIQEMKKVNNDIKILGEYKGAMTKIECKCKIDGYEWSAIPNALLKGHGCPKCNESKGEKRIGKYLDNKNIEYERQYKFDKCRSKKKLPFDFYIPSLNIAIEYDGEYHYMIITRGKNNTYERAFNRFVEGKIRDTIKTIYCKENNIKLIRIPYWDFDRIEEILEKELEEF